MQLPVRPSPRRSPFAMQVAPWLNLVFLLIAFFVWTSNFRIRECTLPAGLATVADTTPAGTDLPPAAERDFDDVVIRILWREGQPAWRINGVPFAKPEALRDSLARIARVKTDAPIVLQPDRDAPLGQVIEVYDWCRLQGLQSVRFSSGDRASSLFHGL